MISFLLLFRVSFIGFLFFWGVKMTPYSYVLSSPSGVTKIAKELQETSKQEAIKFSSVDKRDKGGVRRGVIKDDLASSSGKGKMVKVSKKSAETRRVQSSIVEKKKPNKEHTLDVRKGLESLLPNVQGVKPTKKDYNTGVKADLELFLVKAQAGVVQEDLKGFLPEGSSDDAEYLGAIEGDVVGYADAALLRKRMNGDKL